MKKGSIISVISVKGGCGATTVAANFACGLAKRGKRVLAVDCNLGFRSLDLALGMQDRVLYDSSDLLTGRREASQVCLEHTRYPGLYLLAAPQRLMWDHGESEEESASAFQKAMGALILSLSEMYDVVILDLPTARVDWLFTMNKISDQVLLVSTQEHAALRDADQMQRLARQDRNADCKLLLNRCRTDGLYPDVEEISSFLSCEILGMMMEEDAVRASTERGKPIVGGACESGQILGALVQHLLEA